MGDTRNPVFNDVPAAVVWLTIAIAVCGVAAELYAPFRDLAFEWGAFFPVFAFDRPGAAPAIAPWFLHVFVHGNWMHLLINMFVLYQFGEYVEGRFVSLFGDLMGRINYLLLYFLTIIFANISTFLKHRENPSFASVGASGAISGIVFVYVIFQPWSWLLLFFIIPIPAIVAAVLYLFYSSWASKNSQDFIDHDAHLYGAVFGFWFAIFLKPGLFSLFLDRLVHGLPF